MEGENSGKRTAAGTPGAKHGNTNTNALPGRNLPGSKKMRTSTPLSSPGSVGRMSRGAKKLQALGVDLPAAKQPKVAPALSGKHKSPTPRPAPVTDAAVPSTPTALPLKYSHLLRILENLLLVHKSRPSWLSFSKAKQALTKMNTRMDVNQMGQLVHLCPELSWKNSLTARDLAPRDRLMLTIEHTEGLSVAESEVGIMKRTRQKLKELADSGEDGEVPEVPQATIPDPATISSMNTPSRSSALRSSGSRSQYLTSPASVRGPSSVRTPTGRGRGVKRPLFNSPYPETKPAQQARSQLTPIREGDEISVGDSTPNTSRLDEEENFTPLRARRSSYMQFDPSDICQSDIEMSPAAAKTLQETMRQRSLMTPERIQGRKKGHALAILPETFDLMRAIFRRDNATRIPVKTVIDKMRQAQGGKKGPSEETIRLNLQQVLDHAAHFVQLEHPPGSNVEMLIINSDCNIKETRDGLKQVAKNRDWLTKEDEGIAENDMQN